MSKISELGAITGNNTRSEDLFVTVNLAQGDDGTKNITRYQLVQAIQYEDFDRINITGGNIADVNMRDSVIDDTTINDPNINIAEAFTPGINDNDYFALKDISLNRTVKLTYKQLYDEIAEDSKRAKKIYVSVDGNDNDNGSYMSPVATLDKAFELMNDAVDDVDTGLLSQRSVNIAVMPGTYYTNGNLEMPDFCSMVSTNGQYVTNIVMNDGYEKENCILVGSGCYVQGFGFYNFQVDNFDYPTKGFAVAFRPNATITRSPYIRDCSQISNYDRTPIAPPLNPLNSKGTIEDLGHMITLENTVENPIDGDFELNDTVTFSSGATGTITRVDELAADDVIYIRNLDTANVEVGDTITSSSGGTAALLTLGEEDFPNKEVGRGGGMILADRSVLDQDSIFPYILCFGATPRSPNGLGYVARNGAGINGISSLSIFVRCAFYALDGGQVTLNNSGTQFGDISMRAKGEIDVFQPEETTATLVENDTLAAEITTETDDIIDDMWTHLTETEGYTGLDETLTRRDAGNFLKSIANDFKVGKQSGTRIFTAGLFNYKGQHAFSVFNPTTSGLRYIGSVAAVGDLPAGSTVEVNDAYIVYTSATNFYAGTVYYWNGTAWTSDGANDTDLLDAFVDSWDRMRTYMKTNLTMSAADDTMMDALVDDVLIASVKAPSTITFGSLVESLSHQFNLASAGVNQNALPLNFRRVGEAISAVSSVLQEDGGRVRWSGADELNNQYFARGLRINGRTGRIEGRPFTSSVRKLARRASNSRAQL